MVVLRLNSPVLSGMATVGGVVFNIMYLSFVFYDIVLLTQRKEKFAIDRFLSNSCYDLCAC